ncbi:MAG: hypothetical protein COT14_00270 [Candidatus Diapherotrites archaeon CG08_land_8_20_14_0_20_30_16]|nr:MAG: hypothetical protein COT14_00270 [Candidatus Diapherotrites archaeon CG08_land_8_20_14_0_20_30_16]
MNIKLLLFSLLFIFLAFIFVTNFVHAEDYQCKSEACFMGSCRTIVLTPQQVQSLWNNFLYQYAKPSEMRSGKAVNDTNAKTQKTPAEECPEINVLNETKEMGGAIKIDCETKGVDEKDAKLHETCTGDFSNGMILEKTLRVARCMGQVQNCSVNVGGLQFSNSVTGVALAEQSFFGIFDEKTLTSNITKKNPEEIKKAEDEFLKKEGTEGIGPPPKTTLDDWNDPEALGNAKADVPQRPKSNVLIPNHVQTDDFTAYFQDICTGPNAGERCKIYIYSFFNRFYNSYYSGSLIATAAGPAVWGLTKKAAKLTGLTDLLNKEGSPIKALKYKLFSGGYQGAAEKAAANLRATGLLDGLDADKIKALEKAFAERSSDKLVAALKPVFEKLDTPRKKRALAKFLETRQAYSSVLGAQLKIAAESNPALVRDILIATNDTPAGLGQSMVDLFFEKNPQYAKYFVEVKGADGIVGLASKPAKKGILGTGLSDPKFEPFKDIKDKKIRTLLEVASPTPLPNPVAINKLEGLAKATAEKYVVNVNGSWVHLNEQTLETIKAAYPGLPQISVSVVPKSGFKALGEKESQTIVDEMHKLFAEFGGKTMPKIEARSADMLIAMKTRGLQDAKYANLLNWMLYQQKYTFSQNFIKKFGLTFLGPQVYWMMKTSESSPLKAYFVGEKEMSNVKIFTGSSGVYNDAYIDFFVNETFSSGDFFGEVFIKTIAKTIGTIMPNEGMKKTIFDFAGVKSRDNVKDVVHYITTLENCRECVVVRKQKGNIINVITLAKNDTKNYILEFPDSKTLQDGLSLAVFTHHTNIEFNMGNTSKGTNVNDKINIEQAISAKETCFDKVATSFFGQIPIFDDWFKANASRVGLAVGLIDSTIFYVPMLFLPGVSAMLLGTTGSYLIDTQVMDHFEDCVDSEEGYYIHYVHKFTKESENQGILGGLVSKGKETVATAGAPKPEDTLDKVNKAIDDIKNKLVNLVQDNEKEFLQIEYDTKNIATGKYETPGIFLAWFGPRSTCNVNGEDKKSLISATGKTFDNKPFNVLIDKSQDAIFVNGNKVLQSDLIELAAKNGIFGGYEIPQSATFIPADLSVDYFQMYPNGDFKILDSSTMLCFMGGARQQTGFNYTNSIEYTGLVTAIETENVGSVTPNGRYFSALGGNVERLNIDDSLIVDSNVHVIAPIKKTDLGTLAAVQFQKGVMIYRKTDRDFVLWIKVIASINGRDVQRFWGTPTTVTNPETGCEEQTFDLSVLGNQNDVSAKEKGEKFDQALKKAGPFQYFETPDVALMFYSKLENGECKQYLRAINKKTGKVISDSEIKSIEQTDKGVKITTADGKPHTIEFSNENGKPMLSYNGVKSPLLMAQGRNGSFYFDPSTKEWTVANSQMLPFSDKFATEGWRDTAGVTKPGGNPLYQPSTATGSKGAWDIPLFEGQQRYLFVCLSLFTVIAILYLSIFRKEE